MLADALFWIASQSKPITAAALMMLVDEGKVNLDDPVEKYLPEFKGQEAGGEGRRARRRCKKPSIPSRSAKSSATPAGCPFSSPQEKPTLDALPLREAVRSYAKTPLQSEPGTKYQYSNAGINTAGRIIEVVSGMPYEDFLDKRLFGPLGMKDTTFWPSEEQLNRLAKSYRPERGQDRPGRDHGRPAQVSAQRSQAPADAGGRTVFNGQRCRHVFCQMMLNGGVSKGKRILSEAAVKQMTSKQTGEGINAGYGLGWSTGRQHLRPRRRLRDQHDIDTKSGLITVFMVQHAGFPGNGSQAQGAFRKAAEERFGSARK